MCCSKIQTIFYSYFDQEFVVALIILPRVPFYTLSLYEWVPCGDFSYYDFPEANYINVVEAVFLSVRDYGDIIHRHTAETSDSLLAETLIYSL